MDVPVPGKLQRPVSEAAMGLAARYQLPCGMSRHVKNSDCPSFSDVQGSFGLGAAPKLQAGLVMMHACSHRPKTPCVCVKWANAK